MFADGDGECWVLDGFNEFLDVGFEFLQRRRQQVFFDKEAVEDLGPIIEVCGFEQIDFLLNPRWDSSGKIVGGLVSTIFESSLVSATAWGMVSDPETIVIVFFNGDHRQSEAETVIFGG